MPLPLFAPMSETTQSVTQLLALARDGDSAAKDLLWAQVYEQLRQIAAAVVRRQDSGHVLQTTALANEAAARLLPEPLDRFETRRHLLAFCATVMRRILIDHKRRERHVLAEDDQSFDRIALLFESHSVDVLALDEALEQLAKRDPKQARLVELRFFVGMTIQEAAEELKISESTAIREWRFVKSWLRAKLL